MITEEIQVGSTITDGECSMRVTGRQDGEWIGIYISHSTGTMTGTGVVVFDDQLWHWRHVPFEWREVPQAGIEERYVWSADWRRLEHEVRSS